MWATRATFRLAPTAGMRAHAPAPRTAGVVLAAISEKISVKYRAFCQSELMDKFLHACTGYFSAFFEASLLSLGSETHAPVDPTPASPNVAPPSSDVKL